MSRNKSVFSTLRDYIANTYKEYSKESKNYRCKIINIETKDNKVIFSVMMKGMKSAIVKFLPEDLVLNDQVLKEFSPLDTRAITFFSLQKDYVHQSRNSYICGQEFQNGKTIFIIKKRGEEGEFRKSANELYANSSLLEEFDRGDLKNIIITAIQEQAQEDFAY